MALAKLGGSQNTQAMALGKRIERRREVDGNWRMIKDRVGLRIIRTLYIVKE